MQSSAVFEAVLRQFKNKSEYDSFLSRCEKDYELKIYRVNTMKLTQAQNYFNELRHKYQNQSYSVCETQWHENERRLFIWFIVCYVRLHGSERLEHQQTWAQLSELFFRKDPKLLKYQYMNILKSSGRVYWNEDEDQLLRQAYGKYEKGQWNEVAKYVFFHDKSEQFKNPKHCRERWQNHLDTRIVKDPWSDEEDLQLLTLIKENGKKWSKLSDLMQKRRTEHMIKNRFNSLMAHAEVKRPLEIDQINLLIESTTQKIEKVKYRFLEGIQTVLKQEPQVRTIKEERKFKRGSFEPLRIVEPEKEFQAASLVKEEADENKREHVNARGLSFVNCGKSQNIESSALVSSIEEKLFGSSTSQFFNSELFSMENNWEDKSIIHTPGHFFFEEGRNTFESRFLDAKFRLESKGSFDKSSVAASMELLRPANTDMSQEYKILVSSDADLRTGKTNLIPAKSFEEMPLENASGAHNDESPQN